MSVARLIDLIRMQHQSARRVSEFSACDVYKGVNLITIEAQPTDAYSLSTEFNLFAAEETIMLLFGHCFAINHFLCGFIISYILFLRSSDEKRVTSVNHSP